MPYTLEIEDLENKSKEEVEKEMKYISEENEELRREIRTGERSKLRLEKNETRLVQLMKCYLGMKGEEK
jgi:hypothetical protein